MDGISEAIDKIADKLGVAAGQLVPYFDQYAQMQASVDFIWAVAFAVALSVCVIVLIIDFILWLRNYDCDWSLVIPLVIGAVSAFGLAISYMEYYKWASFPDAMLLDMVIKNLAN